MTSVCLHDKATIERVLRENVYLHIYSIGDLDDFFWPYTTWYATRNDTKISAVAMLYTGQSLPTLLALSENPDRMKDLLGSILHLLPQHFYAHLTPGVESVFHSTHQLDPHGEHLKMALLNRSAVETYDSPETSLLGCDDVSEIVEFYKQSYPGSWFDPRMLETGQYFGIRKDGRLVSVAGIHVYSSEYKVAALGNIATVPSFRNKGFGRQVTAKSCQSLLKDVDHIGLNVKSDNDAAIFCYKKLGFEAIASYNEYLVQRT
jgi:RimJ/RimL family protein N-acetyltransferase